MIERAIAGGLAAPTLGRAFAAAYVAALESMGAPPRAALCVTEDGPPHPRNIRTTLRDGRVTGRKQWATMAADADVLLVASSIGEVEGRNRLRLAVVLPAHATFEAMPETPFAPEILHYRLTFHEAPVRELLPGDGWDEWIKPFRTVEDIYVCAAAAAWTQRAGVDAAVAEEFRRLAAGDPKDARLHLELDAAIQRLRRAAAEADWRGETRALWLRDAPLLEVAERARVARVERARALLSAPPPSSAPPPRSP